MMNRRYAADIIGSLGHERAGDSRAFLRSMNHSSKLVRSGRRFTLA
jgi:hypothetical protein